MSNKIHKLLTILKGVELGKEPKEALRNELLAHIGATAPAVSSASKYRTSSLLTRWQYQVAFTSFLFLMVGGTSLVSAAEGSLPGDFLYGIKTGISEPIARIVKGTNPVSKALFETKLLEKRLVEAEKLETKNALVNGPKEIIAVKVTVQKERAEKATRQASSDRKKPEPEKTKKSDVADTAVMRTLSVEMATPATTTESTSLEPLEPTEKLTNVYEKHQRILEKLEIKRDEVEPRRDSQR